MTTKGSGPCSVRLSQASAENSADLRSESQQHNLEAIRCALETRINQDAGNTVEHKFAQNSLEEINAHGSRLIAASPWTITALEIDFGDELDSGGLYILLLIIFWMRP